VVIVIMRRAGIQVKEQEQQHWELVIVSFFRTENYRMYNVCMCVYFY